MPVDFLTEAQKRRYGRYPEEVSEVQLARYFHVDDTDRGLIVQRRGDANRLGFALQVLTVRFLGTFQPDPTAMPSVVVSHVATQLEISDVACLPRYLDREQTRHAHRGVIRWFGLFDDQPFAEHGERRYGPYRPVGGPIPLHRYRRFKKSATEKRADRIEALADN